MTLPRQLRAPLLLGAMAVLFLIASRGAYRGYFHSDDLDNLFWTGLSPLSTFFEGVLTPQFFPSNFRPVGHFYFWAMGRLAGLNFPPYVAVLHALHILNVIFLWLLLRRLRFSWPAAACGVLLFAFHMAVFDAYWKPMYVFDVLCATFSLLAIILYIDGRTVVSFIAFWLAYKSKELAVAVPLILLLYEYWFGARNWKRVAIFVVAGGSFVLQALLRQHGQAGEYTIHLTPAAAGLTLRFYASQIFLTPYLGFSLLALPLLIRDRRLWWGFAAFALLLAPMIFLPGRLFGAYLYLPLTGLALMFAALVERTTWKLGVALLALWLPLNYLRMRELRKAALAEADQSRAYSRSIAELAKREPNLSTFLVDGNPSAMKRWGVEALLRLRFKNSAAQVLFLEDRDLPKTTGSVALLSWDAPNERLYTLTQDSDASFIEMTRLIPVWQLETGWYPREDSFRWTRGVATARLRWPAKARAFAVTVNLGPKHIAAVHQLTLTVKLDGALIIEKTFGETGWKTVDVLVSPNGPTTAHVEFSVSPVLQSGPDARPLGIPIGSFGFVE